MIDTKAIILALFFLKGIDCILVGNEISYFIGTLLMIVPVLSFIKEVILKKTNTYWLIKNKKM